MRRGELTQPCAPRTGRAWLERRFRASPRVCSSPGTVVEPLTRGTCGAVTWFMQKMAALVSAAALLSFSRASKRGHSSAPLARTLGAVDIWGRFQEASGGDLESSCACPLPRSHTEPLSQVPGPCLSSDGLWPCDDLPNLSPPAHLIQGSFLVSLAPGKFSIGSRKGLLIQLDTPKHPQLPGGLLGE